MTLMLSVAHAPPVKLTKHQHKNQRGCYNLCQYPTHVLSPLVWISLLIYLLVMDMIVYSPSLIVLVSLLGSFRWEPLMMHLTLLSCCLTIGYVYMACHVLLYLIVIHVLLHVFGNRWCVYLTVKQPWVRLSILKRTDKLNGSTELLSRCYVAFAATTITGGVTCCSNAALL